MWDAGKKMEVLTLRDALFQQAGGSNASCRVSSASLQGGAWCMHGRARAGLWPGRAGPGPCTTAPGLEAAVDLCATASISAAGLHHHVGPAVIPTVYTKTDDARTLLLVSPSLRLSMSFGPHPPGPCVRRDFATVPANSARHGVPPGRHVHLASATIWRCASAGFPLNLALFLVAFPCPACRPQNAWAACYVGACVTPQQPRCWPRLSAGGSVADRGPCWREEEATRPVPAALVKQVIFLAGPAAEAWPCGPAGWNACRRAGHPDLSRVAKRPLTLVMTQEPQATRHQIARSIAGPASRRRLPTAGLMAGRSPRRRAAIKSGPVGKWDTPLHSLMWSSQRWLVRHWLTVRSAVVADGAYIPWKPVAKPVLVSDAFDLSPFW